jgi:hypothetical protein
MPLADGSINTQSQSKLYIVQEVRIGEYGLRNCLLQNNLELDKIYLFMPK